MCLSIDYMERPHWRAFCKLLSRIFYDERSTVWFTKAETPTLQNWHSAVYHNFLDPTKIHLTGNCINTTSLGPHFCVDKMQKKECSTSNSGRIITLEALTVICFMRRYKQVVSKQCMYLLNIKLQIFLQRLTYQNNLNFFSTRWEFTIFILHLEGEY